MYWRFRAKCVDVAEIQKSINADFKGVKKESLNNHFKEAEKPQLSINWAYMSGMAFFLVRASLRENMAELVTRHVASEC